LSGAPCPSVLSLLRRQQKGRHWLAGSLQHMVMPWGRWWHDEHVRLNCRYVANQVGDCMGGLFKALGKPHCRTAARVKVQRRTLSVPHEHTTGSGAMLKACIQLSSVCGDAQQRYKGAVAAAAPPPPPKWPRP
jgi:hypothetical protein